MDLDSLPLPVDEMYRARRMRAACMALAAVPLAQRTEAYKAAAAEESRTTGRPCSWKTVQRLFLGWLRAGQDDMALVDKRLLAMRSHKARTSHPKFRSFLFDLAVRNQRKSAPMFRELKRMWAAREVIPGYEDLEGWPSLPQGWTERNLYRMLPGKEELTILRQGVRAGAVYLPQVLATRAGCYPGQFVIWDDVHLDIMVAHGGQMGRPLQIGCLDLLTGKRLAWGTKFRAERKDGTHTGLTMDEMRMLLCTYLVNVGYSPRGTVLIVENGTAAIDKALEEHLSILTHGAVRVDRSGMTGERQALLGGFGGRRVGNPKHKAPLESWHNLLHNEMASLAGAAGHDRTPPEWLHGMLEEQRKMELAKPHMDDGQRAMMLNVLLTFDELMGLLPGIVQRINDRTDHDLEGWTSCGFVSHEYRLDTSGDQWGPLANLDADGREVLMRLEQVRAGHFRTRRLSPNEAWDKATASPDNALVRLTTAQACELMGTHMARKLRRNGAYFRVRDRHISELELIYETRAIKQAGGTEWQEEVPHGQEVRGILNPFDLDRLYLLDEAGRCIGYAQLVNRVEHGDRAAVRAAMGRAGERRADTLQHARVALANTEAEIVARREHNARVMSSPWSTTQDRLEEASARRAEAKARRGALPMDFTPPVIPLGDDLPD